MKFIAGIAIGVAITMALALGFQSRSSDSFVNPSQVTLAPMLDRVMPAIVNISTVGYKLNKDDKNAPSPRAYLGRQLSAQTERTSGVGSGVIVDADNGYVITNGHVIQGATEITVTLIDERVFKARVIGIDRETDVALLQIEPDNLTAVPVVDSNKARVGDYVVAIGNPFGLRHTVTMGIISALGRSGISGGYENMIQTDASINPGNSGGALITIDGKLVGINRAIYAESGGSVGIGFAIPSNMAMNISQELQENGYVRRGLLAIHTINITERMAQQAGLKNTNGAVVARIYRGSPAHRAGVKPGDIIVGMDDQVVTTATKLNLMVGLHDAGEVVTLKLIRRGKAITAKVELGLREQWKVDGSTLHPQLAGITFISARNVNNARIPSEGVVVIEVIPNTPGWVLGLRRGDTILGANEKRAEDIDELRERLKNANAPKLMVQRGRRLYEISTQPTVSQP